MYKTKLVEVFYGLGRSERNQLLKFSQSPYHNTRQDIILLFEYLHKSNKRQPKCLDKKLVYKHVYPQKGYHEKTMYYLISFAYQLVESFFVQQQLKEKPIEQLFLLAQSYEQRAIPKQSTQSLKRIETSLEKAKLLDSKYLKAKFRLEDLRYIDLQHQQKHRNSPINLQEATNALDISFTAQKLKQACLIVSHQAVYKSKYETGLLASLIAFLEENPSYLDYPAIALYYYYYQARTQKTADQDFYFQQFRTKLVQHTLDFPHQEMHDLYLLAINYGIKAYNTGQENYLEQVFELYQEALRQDILIQNGLLSNFAFKNIVGIALKLDQVDWTAAFIEKYKEKLPAEHQAVYLNYGLSKLYFHKKNYAEVLDLLQEVDYKDLFLNISAKVMQLKIYYEQGEFDALDSFLDSFKIFLRRKKVMSYHKDNYLNTIHFTQKLLLVNPFDKTAIAQLQKQIINTSPLSERAWLLEQLETI